MQPTVLLLNPDLTYASPPQMLQGFSGRTYAMSHWNAAYHCHSVELSLADYETCRPDLQKAVHLQMRRWFPRFIVPERPAAVVEFEAGYRLGVEGGMLRDEATGAMRAGWETGREVAPRAGEEPHGKAGVESIGTLHPAGGEGSKSKKGPRHVSRSAP